MRSPGAVHSEQRTLNVRSSKENKPHEVIWNKDTRFVRDGKFDSPGVLKQGAEVCVYYHSPFFGKPFATKVVWRSQESSAPKTL